MPDVKAEILEEAARIVNGARRAAYGTPENNFERIARFWQAYFENTGRPEAMVTAADVSPLMRLMKEARICESPDHRDSHVDLIGYTLTGAEINIRPEPEEIKIKRGALPFWRSGRSLAYYVEGGAVVGDAFEIVGWDRNGSLHHLTETPVEDLPPPMQIGDMVEVIEVPDPMDGPMKTVRFSHCNTGATFKGRHIASQLLVKSTL